MFGRKTLEIMLICIRDGMRDSLFYIFGREKNPISSIRAPIKPRKFPQKHLENPLKHIEFPTSDVFLPL